MKNYIKALFLLMMICVCFQSLSIAASDKKADEIINKVKENYEQTIYFNNIFIFQILKQI